MGGGSRGFGSPSTFNMNPYGGLKSSHHGSPASSMFMGQRTGGNDYFSEQPQMPTNAAPVQERSKPFSMGMPNQNPMAAFNRFDGHQQALDSLRGTGQFQTKPMMMGGGYSAGGDPFGKGGMPPPPNPAMDPAYQRMQQNQALAAQNSVRPPAPQLPSGTLGDGAPRPDLGPLQPGQYGWQTSTLGTSAAFNPAARSYIGHFSGIPGFGGLDQNNLLQSLSQLTGVQFDPNDPRWAQPGSQYYPGR